MNIHEFQAKEVLRRFGVATLKGKIANTPEEAVAAAKEIGGSLWVVKAQIHAGGRGKGGGVKIAKTLDEVRDLAKKILGMTLVTHQTGPEGKKVHKVFIEAGCNIAKEYYVACLIDRATGRVAMMASAEGGMDIEEVAEHNPNAIIKVDIDPTIGLGAWQARELAFAIGMSPEVVNKAVKFMMGLYEAFVKHDCSIA